MLRRHRGAKRGVWAKHCCGDGNDGDKRAHSHARDALIRRRAIVVAGSRTVLPCSTGAGAVSFPSSLRQADLVLCARVGCATRYWSRKVPLL